MSTLTSLLGHAGFILCLLLMGYGLFAPRPKNGSAVHPTFRFVLVRGALVFLALWLWLRVTLPLLGWGFWYGDNDHWFPHYSDYFAVIIALAHAGFVMHRVAGRQASGRYARLHFSGPIALIMLIGIIWVSESIQPIQGTTPRAAAESIVRPYDFGERVFLVEDPQPKSEFAGDPSAKTFWIMGAKEPRGRVAVRPYGWYWWTDSSFHKFEPSSEALQSAKRLLNRRDFRIGLTLLNEVVNNYPGTEAANEAKAMLRRLEEASKDLPKSKVR